MTTSRKAHIFWGLLTGQKNDPNEIYHVVVSASSGKHAIMECRTYRTDFSPEVFKVDSRNVTISLDSFDCTFSMATAMFFEAAGRSGPHAYAGRFV